MLYGVGLAAAVLAVQPLAAQAPQAATANSEGAKAGAKPGPEKDIEKSVFYRAGTDFDTALADVRECDGYARGISYHIGGGAVPYPYAGTVAGAVGGALGSVLADAIFGAAERRKLRRVNMRTCMRFKEYTRYGLTEEAWKAYDLGEEKGDASDSERELLLRLHAKIASAQAAPKGEVME